MIGRAGSFSAAMLKAGDRQRRDAFLVNLPQERAALEQIRNAWTNVFPAAMPEQLAGVDIARAVQRGLRSGAVQVVLLRIPRLPVSPADFRQVASGVINAGTAHQRLLIARVGGLPPEFLAFRNPARAIAVLDQLGNDSTTARQIDLQAGRLSAAGKSAQHGRSLRQNLAWQINAGSLDAAVIAHSPAVAAAKSRPDAPKSIGDMTGNERIGAALQRSLPYAIEAGGEAIRQSIEDMLQPQSILIMIGLAAAVAIANLHPVSGAAVDTTLLLLAWWSGGNEAIGGVTDFAITTLDARDATSERELDEAARAYGRALGRMGPKLLSAIVSRFLKKAGGKSAVTGTPSSAQKAVPRQSLSAKPVAKPPPTKPAPSRKAPPVQAAIKRPQHLFDDLAKQSTRNPDSKTVVLGKFNEDRKSYTKVASHYEATYFKMENWKETTKGMPESEIWKINESFLRQQISQGKQIVLSHDPAKATGFYAREVEYLKSLGYKFEQDNWVWKAVR